MEHTELKKETSIDWLMTQLYKKGFIKEIDGNEPIILMNQAKEMEEKNLLEMLHKFGFDYTYNYRGEKTIYEWIPEWFEEYKRLEQFKNK